MSLVSQKDRVFASSAGFAAVKQRYWEVDVLRGVAISLMVVYHAIYLSWFFQIIKIDPNALPWVVVGKSSATIFLVLVGVSLVLSYSSAVRRKMAFKTWREHQLGRGLGIFGWGVLLTIATYFLFPPSPIWFGVLHFIGIAVLLFSPLIRSNKLVLGVGLFALLFWGATRTLSSSSWYLVWLGIIPEGFSTLDYWPLAPWLALVATGILLGKQLYGEHGRKFSFPWEMKRGFEPLAWLGERSLTVYLLHIPILLLFLWIIALFF